MLIAEDLTQVNCLCIHFVSSSALQVTDDHLARLGFKVGDIDGATIRSAADLLSTLAGQLQFPDYFGANWDALDECLRDMSWCQAPGYIVFFRHAEGFWRRLPRVGGALVESWLFAVQTWERRGTPFHLVFIW